MEQEATREIVEVITRGAGHFTVAQMEPLVRHGLFIESRTSTGQKVCRPNAKFVKPGVPAFRFTWATKTWVPIV